jgi:hypothetical protein
VILLRLVATFIVTAIGVGVVGPEAKAKAAVAEPTGEAVVSVTEVSAHTGAATTETSATAEVSVAHSSTHMASASATVVAATTATVATTTTAATTTATAATSRECGCRRHGAAQSQSHCKNDHNLTQHHEPPLRMLSASAVGFGDRHRSAPGMCLSSEDALTVSEVGRRPQKKNPPYSKAIVA